MAPKVVPVSIPDYGDFHLRVMKFAEVKAWVAAGKGLDLLLCYTVCDKDGNRTYKIDEANKVADDYDWPLVDKLTDEALRINKFRKEDTSVKTVAEHAKN